MNEWMDHSGDSKVEKWSIILLLLIGRIFLEKKVDLFYKCKTFFSEGKIIWPATKLEELFKRQQQKLSEQKKINILYFDSPMMIGYLFLVIYLWILFVVVVSKKFIEFDINPCSETFLRWCCWWWWTFHFIFLDQRSIGFSLVNFWNGK